MSEAIAWLREECEELESLLSSLATRLVLHHDYREAGPLGGEWKLATIRVIEPDGASRERVYWDARYERDPDKAGWTERDWEDAVLESVRAGTPMRPHDCPAVKRLQDEA